MSATDMIGARQKKLDRAMTQGLTAGHGGCSVSVHQTWRGAIPEADGSKRRRVWVSARTCRRFALPTA
jgi:hypothetical protein